MSKKLVIDGRHLKSGLGTYTKALVPRLIDHGPWSVSIIGPESEWRSLLAGREAEILPEESELYSLSSRFRIGRLVKDADLWWSPHPVLPFFLSCPVVVSIHDLIHLVFPEKGPRQWLKQHILNYAVKRAQEIVTVSVFSRQELLRFYPRISEKVTVVHNGISPPPPPQTTDDGQGDVLMVANLLPHKNLEAGCRAFLAGAPADQKMAIVGSGQRHKRRLMALVQESQGRLRHIEKASSQELDQLMRQAPFVLCPSHYEGFGLVPLEAVARGTPALATSIPAFREVLGEQNVSMECDEDSMTQAITRACRGELDLKDLLARQSKRLEQFTWERASETLIRVLKCAKRGAR